MINPKSITGFSLSDDQFQLYESNTIVDVNIVNQVISGKLAAYKISGYLSENQSLQILNNFWSSSAKVPRVGYGDDGIEGYFLGASHIEKQPQTI